MNTSIQLAIQINHKKQALVLQQNEIEQVECIYFFGFYIHKHLSWSRRMNHLISKPRIVLETVIKVKSLLNKDFSPTLSLFYQPLTFL